MGERAENNCLLIVMLPSNGGNMVTQPIANLDGSTINA